MHQRKIQLIAGSTYTVSLPKEWLKKAKLKERSQVLIEEREDMSLIVHPTKPENTEALNEITINIDEFCQDINQIIYSIYYLGIEDITLKSKKKIDPSTRAKIKKALAQMTGTETVYEDENMMKIKVLLDQGKVDVDQLFFRVSLIISSSVNCLLESPDINEILQNENEIDRLYNLLAKTISLSSMDATMLKTSGINNMSFIIPYIIISKKMENIGDHLKNLSEYCIKDSIKTKDIETELGFIRDSLKTSIKFLINKKDKIYKKTDMKIIKDHRETIHNLKDDRKLFHLHSMLRFIVDIEESLVNLSFYRNYKNLI